MNYDSNPKYGQWWLRVFGRVITLKAPWCEPLFSERFGIDKPFRLGFGWRLLYENFKNSYDWDTFVIEQYKYHTITKGIDLAFPYCVKKKGVLVGLFNEHAEALHYVKSKESGVDDNEKDLIVLINDRVKLLDDRVKDIACWLSVRLSIQGDVSKSEQCELDALVAEKYGTFECCHETAMAIARAIRERKTE